MATSLHGSMDRAIGTDLALIWLALRVSGRLLAATTRRDFHLHSAERWVNAAMSRSTSWAHLRSLSSRGCSPAKRAREGGSSSSEGMRAPPTRSGITPDPVPCGGPVRSPGARSRADHPAVAAPSRRSHSPTGGRSHDESVSGAVGLLDALDEVARPERVDVQGDLLAAEMVRADARFSKGRGRRRRGHEPPAARSTASPARRRDELRARAACRKGFGHPASSVESRRVEIHSAAGNVSPADVERTHDFAGHGTNAFTTLVSPPATPRMQYRPTDAGTTIVSA
jgi:hypothetical protein